MSDQKTEAELAAEMKVALAQRAPQEATLLVALADEHRAAVVGGAVRDLLQGREVDELDLVVEGRDGAEEIAKRITKWLGGELISHERFGTYAVARNGLELFDVATARSEQYPRPGALPETVAGTIEDDLARRDFTVNAIAYLLGESRIIAAPQAVEDLRERRLRVLHDQSFIDDPTRLLRMVRYASRLHFEIESHTLELANTAIDSGALATISADRVAAELDLCFLEPDPVQVFLLLQELGVFNALGGSGQTPEQLIGDAVDALPLKASISALLLGAAALAAGSQSEKFLGRTTQQGAARELARTVATDGPRLAAKLELAEQASEIGAVLAGRGAEAIALAYALGDRTVRQRVREWEEQISRVELEISGDDLLAVGVDPGPELGAALEDVLAAKRDGAVSGRRAELEFALQSLQGQPR